MLAFVWLQSEKWDMGLIWAKTNLGEGGSVVIFSGFPCPYSLMPAWTPVLAQGTGQKMRTGGR